MLSLMLAAPRRSPLILAAALGFLAVLAGTFGAHGLDGRVEAELLPTYEVGVRYLMYHALALLALAAHLPRLGRAGTAVMILWTLGGLIFFGTLVALTLTGLRWFGAITPVGGLGLLAGWVTLGVASLRGKPPVEP